MASLKNKIKKFSKGDFRTVHPEIVLPVTNLEMTIGEGESCQGSFILKNRKEGDIRGLVYSSSFQYTFSRNRDLRATGGAPFYL